MKYLFIFFLCSCGGLFYQPHKQHYSNPQRFKIHHEEKYFSSLDKTQLHAWILKPNSAPKGTFIFFHGNAENISTHFFQVAWLTLAGYQVFIFDYRGYGLSEGEASKEGIYLDAQAALDEAWKLHKETSASKKFIVYGQSLGGIIVVPALVKFSQEKEVDLLILDSTFSSYQKIAFDKLTDSWLTFLVSPLAFILVSDHLASKKDLSNLKVKRTLVIHGKKDFIVPYKFGKQIFNIVPSPKDIKLFRDAPHIQAFNKEENRNWMIDYLTSH